MGGVYKACSGVNGIHFITIESRGYTYSKVLDTINNLNKYSIYEEWTEHTPDLM